MVMLQSRAEISRLPTLLIPVKSKNGTLGLSNVMSLKVHVPFSRIAAEYVPFMAKVMVLF